MQGGLDSGGEEKQPSAGISSSSVLPERTIMYLWTRFPASTRRRASPVPATSRRTALWPAINDVRLEDITRSKKEDHVARQARQTRPQLVWFWPIIAARWREKRPRPQPKESARCSWSASRAGRTGLTAPYFKLLLIRFDHEAVVRPLLRHDPRPQNRPGPRLHRRSGRTDRYHRRAGAYPDAAETLHASPPAAS